jgi:hypothetical protein
MKLKLAIAAAVAAAIVIAALFLWPRPAPKVEPIAANDPLVPFLKAAGAMPPNPQAPPPPPVDVTKPSQHGSGIDRKVAQLLAMDRAPEGATPCESGWNAIAAEQEAAKKLGKRSIFVKVAERSEFMRICNGLSKDAQQCMSSRYMNANRDKCQILRPPAETLSTMYEIRPELISPDEDPPPPAPNP